MRTTLNLDTGLLREAKQRAAREGTTLTRVLEAALRRFLAPPASPARPFKLNLLTCRGRPVPGVDLEDRDALYDRMEGTR